MIGNAPRINPDSLSLNSIITILLIKWNFHMEGLHGFMPEFIIYMPVLVCAFAAPELWFGGGIKG